MKKKIIISLLVLGIIGAGIGYYMGNKTHESVSSMKTYSSIDSKQLLAEFENNEAQANERFLDKVLEVQGAITQIEQEADQMTIYLDTGNPMSNIICQMDPKSTIHSKKGEIVKIKGICTGYLMDVVLVRSVII